jgi:DNA-binding transcriptional MerR regulator
MIENGFPTDIAAKLGGVSAITLDTWSRRSKFLVPSMPAPRRGVPKRYSFRDVVAIRVASELRAAGISVGSLRRVVNYLRARKGLSCAEALASTQLVTDGHDVYEVSGEQSISALRRPGQRVLFVVPLDELVTEIQTNARSLVDGAAPNPSQAKLAS